MVFRVASGGGGGPVSLTIGTTAITGGNANRWLYDNAGVLGEAAALTASSVVFTDSNGLPTSTGTVSIAKGGTNSGASLNSNRFMISSSGAIVEASAIGATAVVFTDTNGLPTGDATNFNYTSSSGPRLQVGSSNGTSAGLIIGYSGAYSGYGMIWPTSITPAASNYAFGATTQSTIVNVGNGGTLTFSVNEVQKFNQLSADGRGIDLIPGTAITDVAALTLTRTNNNAAVVRGVVWTFTDTTSAATFKPFHIIGGSGSTDLFYITKQGVGLVGAVAFASLPTGVAGMFAYITDSTTTTWGATIAGSGANKVLAFYNGTNWTVAGA